MDTGRDIPNPSPGHMQRCVCSRSRPQQLSQRPAGCRYRGPCSSTRGGGGGIVRARHRPGPYQHCCCCCHCNCRCTQVPAPGGAAELTNPRCPPANPPGCPSSHPTCLMHPQPCVSCQSPAAAPSPAHQPYMSEKVKPQKCSHCQPQQQHQEGQQQMWCLWCLLSAPSDMPGTPCCCCCEGRDTSPNLGAVVGAAPGRCAALSVLLLWGAGLPPSEMPQGSCNSPLPRNYGSLKTLTHTSHCHAA
jgi:hypothetical protein